VLVALVAGVFVVLVAGALDFAVEDAPTLVIP
jgi:hypothetical protein